MTPCLIYYVRHENKCLTVSRVVGGTARNRKNGFARWHQGVPVANEERLASDRQRGAEMGQDHFVFYQNAADERAAQRAHRK
jgi:hypothetical protein